MNLARIIPIVNSRIYGHTDDRLKSNFAHTETAKGVFLDTEGIFSENHYEFYINLIHMLDEAINRLNLNILSSEQRVLLTKYFDGGNSISPLITEPLYDWIYDYDSLDTLVLELDEFLGSYTGDETDAKYASYRTKKLYS